MFPVGPAVNAAAIVVGSLIGLTIGSKLSEKMRETIFQCLGLISLLIGIQMLINLGSPMIVILSLLTGAVIGEILNLEDKINSFGDFLKDKMKSDNPKFTNGVVITTLLFCIGALPIMGALDEGLRGDRSLLFSKAILDCFSAIAFAAAYGIGVILSAIGVLVVEGGLVILAEFLSPYIDDVLLTEIGGVCGLLIIAVAFNLLEFAKIRVTNLLPAIFVAIILTKILY